MSAMAQTCGGQGTLAGQPATTPAWMNPADATWTADFPYTPANRAAALLNAMTLAQMEQQMAGVGGDFGAEKRLPEPEERGGKGIRQSLQREPS